MAFYNLFFCLFVCLFVSFLRWGERVRYKDVEFPGDTPIWNGRGCSSGMLNWTPKRAWPNLFFTPNMNRVNKSNWKYISLCASRKETITAKYNGVLNKTPLTESKILNLQHPRSFYVGIPPGVELRLTVKTSFIWCYFLLRNATFRACAKQAYTIVKSLLQSK